MPRKPLKSCRYGNCPNLTDGVYCDEHKKQETRHYNRFDRDPATNVRYGAAWRKIRALFLAANPLCEMCNREGRLMPATLVHHKRKLSDGGTHDWENLSALCQECHSRLHAEQGDRWG